MKEKKMLFCEQNQKLHDEFFFPEKINKITFSNFNLLFAWTMFKYKALFPRFSVCFLSKRKITLSTRVGNFNFRTPKKEQPKEKKNGYSKKNNQTIEKYFSFLVPRYLTSANSDLLK